MDPSTDVASFAAAWITALAAVAGGAVLIHRFVAFTTLVRSGSMRPALEPGDLVLTTRMHRTGRLRRGDLVVFRSPHLDEALVKRLIGLPGERVELAEEGVVRIDGEVLPEPYARRCGAYRGTFEVPVDRYLFLGDDRGASIDARSWADPYVDRRDLLGVARIRLRPNRWRPAGRPTVSGETASGMIDAWDSRAPSSSRSGGGASTT
jgi:signal peptidase I